MKNTMILFALALLAGCSTHKPEPHSRPTGNMPMTEQEYKQAELFLLKEQKLPPEEYTRRKNQILVR